MRSGLSFGHTYVLLFFWLMITLLALPEKAAWISLGACVFAAIGTGLVQAWNTERAKTPPAPLPPRDPDDCPECGSPKLYTTCQALGCPAWCCWVCGTGPCDWDFDRQDGSCAHALAGEPQ